MSRIVFFCIPAYGHTNPTLGVVRELVQRGHEVQYYSYEPFREQIKAAGAEFVGCDQYDAERKLSPQDAVRVGRNLAFSTRLLVDTTLALDDMVCSEMERVKPDCIVADSMAVWGKAVAWKLGIPFVSSTTTFAFNQYSAKIMKQSLREIFGMIFSMPQINRDIRRLQDSGYPVKSVLDILQNDEFTDTIVYTSPEFQPCSETFSDKYAFVGPSVRPASGSFEKTRDKLVYLSMGTVNNDMLRLYKNCIAALGSTDYQVVLSVGELTDQAALGPLPENISIFAHVDQIAVLEKADVFISHCGMNSVNESLYYGVPLILFPQTAEQGGVAARVRQLEAGEYLRKNSVTAIREAVEQVTGSAAYRQKAAQISEGFKKCGQAAAAAEKILQVCRGG